MHSPQHRRLVFVVPSLTPRPLERPERPRPRQNHVRNIGKGAFGKVLCMEKRDNKQKFAVKTMNKRRILRKDRVDM